MGLERLFIYDSYVTGADFIGRERECTALGNLLRSGENVVIYEPPKSGKMSVIQQTVKTLRARNPSLAVLGVDFHNARSLEALLTKFGNCVIRAMATTPEEYSSIIQTHLDGTHFTFDPQRFSTVNEAVSLNWDPDENDVKKLFCLPSSLAADKKKKTITIITEFQSIDNIDDSDMILRCFKEALKTSSAEGNTFIITGSRYNEMRSLFHYSPLFHTLVEHLPLGRVDDREIVEFLVKSIDKTGKVLEKDLGLGACRLFRGNLWYLNHFFTICNSLTRGFISDIVMLEALKILISIHEMRFKNTMDNLTTHQVNFLLAAVEGVARFTSSEVIRRYSLNSSANVARVREALLRKEIITFDEHNKLIITDPLFDYWLRKYFFGKEVTSF